MPAYLVGEWTFQFYSKDKKGGRQVRFPIEEVIFFSWEGAGIDFRKAKYMSSAKGDNK